MEHARGARKYTAIYNGICDLDFIASGEIKTTYFQGLFIVYCSGFSAKYEPSWKPPRSREIQRFDNE